MLTSIYRIVNENNIIFQTGKPLTPTVSSNSPVIKTRTSSLTCYSRPDRTGTITYSWTREDGKPIRGSQDSTTGSLTITDVQSTDAGNYICTASNVAGDTSSLPLYLEVLCKKINIYKHTSHL